MATEIYGDTSGESNVHSYQTGKDWILVTFGDGSKYLYTYSSAGKSNVEFMKRQARRGFGLNSFITRFVRKQYASKGAFGF